MNLVSTVTRVIDVPPTQIWGVAPTWPASTAAISSSVASKTVPPLLSMSWMVGFRNAAPLTSARTTTTATATPATPPTHRAAWPRPWCTEHQGTADHRVGDAPGAASVAGEPMSGITKNGSTNVATSEPAVLTASRVPVAEPSVPRLVAQERGGGRERDAHRDRGGEDDEGRRAAKSRSAVTKSHAPAVERIGGRASTAAPTITKAAVAIWATAISATVDRTRGRSTPSSPAPSAMPRRNRTRMIVNT